MKKTTLIVLVFLMATACSRQSFDKGDIVESSHGDVTNEERLYSFYENTKNGKKDAVRIISYTTEGDPIYQDLFYNGSVVESKEDHTEDQYGSGEIVARECESIIILSSETEEVYMLEGCSPESGMDTILDLTE